VASPAQTRAPTGEPSAPRSDPTPVPKPPPTPPRLRLGSTRRDGIGASIFALLDRGVMRRPHVAAEIRAEVELRFVEDYAPVRMLFAQDLVLVEDGAAQEPDIVVTGRLPDIVALTHAPLLAGWPNPALRRGRAALARVADGRVRIQGPFGLARKLLRLFEV
jgi:hypothetical protein